SVWVFDDFFPKWVSVFRVYSGPDRQVVFSHIAAGCERQSRSGAEEFRSIAQLDDFIAVESHVQVGFPGQFPALQVLRGNAELYSAVTNRSGIHPNVRISGRSGQGLLVEEVIGTVDIQVYHHADAVPQARLDTDVGSPGLGLGEVRVPLLIGRRAGKRGGPGRQ